MIVVWVIGLPLLGGLVALVAGHRLEIVAPAAGVASCVASWIGAVIVCVGRLGDAPMSHIRLYRVETGATPIEVGFSIGALSASMLILATTVAALVQIYSVAYLKGDPRYPSYTALVCLFTSAMCLVVTAGDMFVLLVGWEVMGACSYFLISHHWELPEARAGAVKAFLVTRLGDVGLLFGIIVAGHEAGSYQIDAIVAAATSGAIGHPTVVCLLLMCGVVGKSAQFPLHSWLPDAMPGPTPISALIHAATMVAAGVFLVARMLPLFEASTAAMTLLAVIASITMVGAALMALAADDLKRVLAWSTVSQLAYMFGGLSLGDEAAGVLHLLSHGAFKALLFLGAGSVIHTTGTQRLVSMGGLRRLMPLTFWTTTVGFAALAGVPPFVGFFSKDAILSGAAAVLAGHGLGVRPVLVLLAGLITALLTAAYAMRAWLLVFFGPLQKESQASHPHESPALMTWPLVFLASLATIGGLLVLWPHFLGLGGASVNIWMMLLSAALVLVGAGFTAAEWWRLEMTDPAATLGRWRPLLAHEFRYDAILEPLVSRLAAFGSRVVLDNERSVIDPYVRAGGGGAAVAGRLVRRLHNGNVLGYVSAVLIGALAIAVAVGVWS